LSGLSRGFYRQFFLILLLGANRKGQVKEQTERDRSKTGTGHGTEGGTGRQAESTSRMRSIIEWQHFYITFLYGVVYILPNPCVSHESRLRVRVFTTVFPGWSMAASSSRPRGTVLSRQRDFCSSCDAWRLLAA